MFPFEVDTASDVPLWVQLRQRLIYLISSGYFKPGDQLPTVRGLASEISINYNTVNKAYLSLVSDGYLESTRGRGVFVRDLDAEVDEEFSHELDGILGDCIDACRCLGMSYDDIGAAMTRKLVQVKRDERSVSAKHGATGGTSPQSSSARIVEVDMGTQSRRSGTGA